MTEFSSNKIVIDPIMKKFLDSINSQGGAPIYELSPADARNVLLKIQDVPVNKLEADTANILIPVGPSGHTNIQIVRPKDNNAQLPAIMYFHGGGWILGDEKTHDRLVREIANGAQVAVMVVDFKRSPEATYPVAVEEAYAACKYVAENDKSLNVDASKLVVAGDSVGGNMATVTAILAKERGGPKIAYQVLFYPVTDANFETDSYNEFANGYWLTKEAMKWFWNAYAPDVNDRKKHTVSPLLASLDQLEGLPPALVITNEYDVLRDEGEAYAHKLIEAGVKTTAIRLLGTIHDCLLLNAIADSTAVRGAISIAVNKLKEVFNH